MGFVFAFFLFTWFDWKTLKTENFTVIYNSEYYWEAIQTLQNLEYYRQEIVDLTGNDTRNVPVVIEDLGTMSNGFADPFLYNIHIFTYPPGFGSSLEGIENWYRTVSVHEYTHIAHLTKTKGFSKTLTGLFGAPFQSNMYTPGWIIEGITVFSESRISQYEGRLNDGFFDSYIGARVHDNKFPSIIEATNSPLAFPYGGIYLYGGEFFDFLSKQYGTESFRRFFDVYGSYFWSPLSVIFPCTGFDIAGKKVYGKSFSELFAEWQQFEENRFAHWEMEGKRITEKGWYISSLISDGNKLYYVSSQPVKLDAFYHKNIIQIIELEPSSEKEKAIVSLNSSVTTPLRIYNNNLFYTTLELKRGMANVWLNGFGATSILHRRNLLTNEDKILFTDDIRAFCVLPDNSILFTKDRNHRFGSELWIYTEGKCEKVWETDYLINELEANKDWIVALSSSEFENPDLYTLDLEAKELTPLLFTPWTEGKLCLTVDNILLFTANYDEKHAIYSIHLIEKNICRLTSNGFANSGAVIGTDKALYYIGLNSDGNDIYKKEYYPEHYELPDWQQSIKPNFHENEVEIKHGGYSDVLKTLLPAVRIPFVFPKDKTLKQWYVGGIILGGDATNENIYAGYFAYDPVEENPVLNLFWQSMFLAPLNFNLFYEYKDSVNYGFYYPIISKLNPGLTNLILFINGSSFENFNRKEISSGFNLKFSYPLTTFLANISFPFERQAWGSEINRNAQFFKVGIKQLLIDGDLSFWAAGFSDLHNPDTNSIRIRGYESITTPEGLVLKTEYSHALLKFRKGLWNPNIYFEDIFGSIFFDYGVTYNGESYYSVGCELKLEAKIGFGYLQFVPKLGFAITKDRQAKVFFEISPLLQNPYF
jgi:hypothetical protein